MLEFNTGAVRSNDAENEAWYLISPIAWKRLALAYGQLCIDEFAVYNDLRINLSECIREIRDYLAGSRSEVDPLARALMYLCEALQIEETESPTPIYPTPLEYIDFIQTRYDAISPVGLRRIAERYRLGEKKYSAYNCEKGFPVHDLLNHAIRHIQMHLAGNVDEPGDDNLGGVAWGLCMAMHSEEMWPELNRGYLRGPNCSMTPDIEEKIEEWRKLKASLPKDFDYHNHTQAEIIKAAQQLESNTPSPKGKKKK
jgi:hypothetical protein